MNKTHGKTIMGGEKRAPSAQLKRPMKNDSQNRKEGPVSKGRGEDGKRESPAVLRNAARKRFEIKFWDKRSTMNMRKRREKEIRSRGENGLVWKVCQ